MRNKIAQNLTGSLLINYSTNPLLMECRLLSWVATAKGKSSKSRWLILNLQRVLKNWRKTKHNQILSTEQPKRRREMFLSQNSAFLPVFKDSRNLSAPIQNGSKIVLVIPHSSIIPQNRRPRQLLWMKASKCSWSCKAAKRIGYTTLFGGIFTVCNRWIDWHRLKWINRFRCRLRVKIKRSLELRKENVYWLLQLPISWFNKMENYLRCSNRNACKEVFLMI
jgi:hypothetical protein